MKEFRGLELCDLRSKRIDMHVRADLVDGKLTISGHDLGPNVESFWGEAEYEYWYSFDEENTGRLLTAIHGEEDPEGGLMKRFSGEKGCRALCRFCEQKGIEYSFFSYV